MAAHHALSLVHAGCYEEAENACLIALHATPDNAQLYVALLFLLLLILLLSLLCALPNPLLPHRYLNYALNPRHSIYARVLGHLRHFEGAELERQLQAACMLDPMQGDYFLDKAVFLKVCSIAPSVFSELSIHCHGSGGRAGGRQRHGMPSTRPFPSAQTLPQHIISMPSISTKCATTGMPSRTTRGQPSCLAVPGC